MAEVTTFGHALFPQFGLPPEWIFGEGELNWVSEPAYIDRALTPVLLVVVAAAVYVADLRPKLKSLDGGSGGGPSLYGPY